MRPWTIDADDIQIATDFDAQLLHRTPWIEDFLDSSRDDKFIVVGTKGFGKTLLLKAKRIGYQEAGRLCIPQGSLLDKPVGDKVFSREMLQFFGEGPEPWSKLWLTAIAAAVLKQLEMTDALSLSPQFQHLLQDQQLRSVLDHFVNLLDFAPSELHRCANDTNNQLVPRLRSMNTPVAVFIDSVDEYFNKHIHAPTLRASQAGELSPTIWFLSQMALVEVSYQLRRITKHLKVFAAVRREAFQKLADVTPMVQQYRGSAIDLVYSESSLRQIFINNVRPERPKNLVLRSRLASDPIEAFLGRTEVSNAFTGEHEDVFEYILRHTLLRPRDLMTVGQKLAAMSPEERAQERRFQAGVNDAATEIAQEYLNEIEPHIGDIGVRALLSWMPSNVVSRQQLDELCKRYEQERPEDGPGAGLHALGTLYKVGLLGDVHTDPISGQRVQRFLLPGEGGLDHEAPLPSSPYYLVRPVLSGYAASLNPDYPESMDRANIIGNGRPWRDPEQPAARREERRLAALKADIVNFHRLMEDDEVDQAVRRALARALRDHASGFLHSERVGGDGLLIVHDDPNALVRTATRIREDLFSAPGNPRLRSALDFGPIKLERHASGLALAGGTSLLRVARIEPLVTPGEIWATEEFVEELRKKPTLYGATEIEGGLNLKKADSREEDTFIPIFQMGPSSSI